MIKLFEQCPACGGPLIVTECRCANCQLLLRGEFQPKGAGAFSTLSEDQLTFLRVFVRVRGNLSEVEKVLGVSYPTIRNKLDEINKALDRAEASPPAGPAKPADAAGAQTNPVEEARQAVLQQVAAGKLSAAEALQKLRDEPRGRVPGLQGDQ
jgi:hypothetical protein